MRSPVSTSALVKQANFTHDSPEKESFKTTQAQVIGISSDPVEKQKEFVEKNKLTVSKHARPRHVTRENAP